MNPALCGADGLALVRPGSLLPPVTYTRTGPATGVTAAGLIYEVAANVPRFDAAGRLIWEGQSTTSTLRTQELGNAVWNPNGVTTAQTGATGPDGATASWLVTESGASVAHRLVQSYSVSAGGLGHATAIIAAGTRRYVNVFCVNGTAEFGAQLDTTTMTIAGYQNGAGTLIGSRISTLANGFRKVDVWGTLTAITSYFAGIATSDAVYAGNSQPAFVGTSTVQIWAISGGAGRPGSYLGATTLAVTRGSDTGVFNLFGSAGTIAFSAVPGQAAPTGLDQTLYTINDGTDANRLSVVNVAGGNSIVLRRVVAGAVTDSAAIGTQTPGTLLRGVLTWSGTTASAKLQGGTWQTQTSTSGGFTLGRLGNIIAGSSPLFGTLGWGDLLPRSVTEAEADAIMARIPA
jgi:hypothetical protein